MTRNQQINVRFLPALIDPESMRDSTAIVIDVLRATTTICAAMSSGAKSIVPCLEIDDAVQLRSAGKADACGGERGGVTINGFEFGNSPLEYSPEKVAGQTIAFTTTNGTRAMKACHSAGRLLLASFPNLSAIVELIANDLQVEIICAGTDGEITAEDALLAGAIVDRAKSLDQLANLNDQALVAMNNWRFGLKTALEHRISDSKGGRNLIRLKREPDIQFASQVDLYDFVPVVDLNSWIIGK